MPKTCISIYNEFSNIGPTRRTWPWRLKVKLLFSVEGFCDNEVYIALIEVL